MLQQQLLMRLPGINKTLSDGKVNIKIVVKHAPEGVKRGTLDKAWINMIENPDGSGTLGYGPLISNPLTGEIVSARVNMYLGNIILGIKKLL